MNGNTMENVKAIGLTSTRSKIDINLYPYLKRGFDLVASSIGLLFSLPLFLIIAILIKLDSKGKVIFKHKRIGKDGRYIYLYKFRTMYSNADEIKKNFTKEQIEEYERNFKLENDPRVTRIGNILRKTSLDELPQLINIIKGDMSLIGPRPVVDKEIEKFGMYQRKFLSVLPGLTGYWASHGRSDTTYDERVKMEIYYVNHASVKLDTKILFKTISAVLKRTGAK